MKVRDGVEMYLTKTRSAATPVMVTEGVEKHNHENMMKGELKVFNCYVHECHI